MKKWLAALFAALLLALAMTALADVPDRPAEFAYAYDLDGGVLSGSQIEEISAYGEALAEATGAQAIAVVVDFLDGMSAADYATDLINEWGVGSEDEDNGVVVLLARGDREIHIGTGRGLDRKLTGSKCGELIDDNIDYFARNQFGAGVTALYADVCEYIARVEGKRLAIAGASAPAQADNRTGFYDAAQDDGDGGLFDGILGLIVAYIIISVVINALFRGKSCCLKMFFLGWLFDRNDRPASRPYTPPAQRYDSAPHRPINTRPMSGGTGGLFGGSTFGGGIPHRPAPKPRPTTRAPRSTFGGGSSRGGGAGRSFGSSTSRSSFGGSSRSSFGGSSRSSFGGGRSFGGGSSRGGGGGRKF